VSEKHAGFVVNKGGATTADILELGRQVSEKVLNETGVELEMEVKYIG
ncbi:MAG: UDP-N-acetylenolpyruvoylglucosamine reductase, partial [Acutalibacteraceae bacterium]|nr:UDP-N-acetylenolpyruvoylglucosamine reductase [Acutalibacteraceae bacterium]